MAKRFLKTAVVSALFALTLAVSASAASAGGATTTTAVNFRTGAGTNYGIISTLPAGTHVVVSTRSSGGWATVVYNGTVGYISSDYLKRANEMDASFGTGTINGSYVRMRSGASTSSSILGTYNSGTTMTITGVNGAWYKVSYNGTTGYVHSDYVSLSGVTNGGSSTGSSNGSVKGSDVRMRSGPSTNYSILGTYQNGTPLTITGTENGWTKVTIGGVSGYIRSDYVSGGGADLPPTAGTLPEPPGSRRMFHLIMLTKPIHNGITSNASTSRPISIIPSIPYFLSMRPSDETFTLPM